MQRFHVAVDDLQHSFGLYSALFAAQPCVIKTDYAKSMLDDPRVNFAISTRGRQPGLDHLGSRAFLPDRRRNKSSAAALQRMVSLSAYAGLGMSPEELAARYREHAAKCVAMARRFGEAAEKLELLDMAQAWLALAEQAAKNPQFFVVYESPPSAAPPPTNE